MPNVEIVYALPHRTVARSLSLPAGARIADALQVLTTDPQFRELDLASVPLGIFGKAAGREQVLKDGDRIEIYRPLLEDAKLARRNRARGKPSKSDRS
jgi:putative ubiquitin-RnfH superfamily antitoxin RatB of RatAB toxin-antitoxin module